MNSEMKQAFGDRLIRVELESAEQQMQHQDDAEGDDPWTLDRRRALRLIHGHHVTRGGNAYG